MRAFPCLFLLFSAVCSNADTWPCSKILTSGPVLSPPTQNLCSTKTLIGGQYTQVGSYTLQQYNLQSRLNQGTAIPVNVTGTGTCTSSLSPFPNGYPQWGPPSTQQLGAVLNWSTMISNTQAVYFTVQGVNVIYSAVQQASTIAGLTAFNAPACQCFTSDCCNSAIGTNCQATCPTRGCQSCGGGAAVPATTCTPILIDVTGQGFDLTSKQDGVWFDVWGNGQMVQIAWPSAPSGNGWLALPDANGRVTNLSQLFGNLTPQPPAIQPNGFLALAVYDLPANGGNGDGIISPNDAIWQKLRVWVDGNHDGISQPGELLTLEQAGLLSISLDYRDIPHTDEYGNLFRLRGTICDMAHMFQPREAIWDVWLQ